MGSAQLDQEILLEIIHVQTEIARLDLDLGRIMHFAADAARRLTGADGAIVELLEDQEMVYRAAAGMAERQLGLRLSRVGSLSGMCLDQGRILICDDSETDPRVDRDVCRRVGLRSMAVAPLVTAGNAIGVLKVAARAPGHFQDRDLQILRLVSDMVAAEMRHATVFASGALYHSATHDPLTGLANRALFFDRLRQETASERRRVGVLALDLDGLKGINDTLGHRAGDAALCEVAERLRQDSRRCDTAARLGGDEFAMIIHGLDDRQGLAARADRLRDTLDRPFQFQGRPIPVGASIGAALFPEDALDVDDLLEQADQAMYAAKRARRMHANSCWRIRPAPPPRPRSESLGSEPAPHQSREGDSPARRGA